MADGSSKDIDAVAFRGCFLEVLRREQLCKVINQLCKNGARLTLVDRFLVGLGRAAKKQFCIARIGEVMSEKIAIPG